MNLRRRRSYYQQLAEFERGSKVELKKDGFLSTIMHEDLVGMYPLCTVFGSSCPSAHWDCSGLVVGIASMGKLLDLDTFDGGQILDARRMSHSISEIVRQLGVSRRIVCIQQSQTLAQIVTQLKDGASHTVSKRTRLLLPSPYGFQEPSGCTSFLANIWLVIPMERFKKFVKSMPRRVAAVIKFIGGPIRYQVHPNNIGLTPSNKIRWAEVAQWSRSSGHGRHVMTWSPVPLKTHRVGQ
ncbi:hypothetical protein TNCV_4322191 [Trichonephila clavipes]|uniref:Uncharacterized protein n=1 Tax=Trichonephila clavipes TaxID=2585209 RepID=A0A8X6SE27_TRICX|nr:hypothetical protein TNCV_4322191 [Trichonephila clavipes]